MNKGIEMRNMRKSTGLSAREFAKCIGVSLCTVYDWERGIYSTRSKKLKDRIDTLVSVFTKLKSDPDYLVKVLRK